jgi:hypothetical protein
VKLVLVNWTTCSYKGYTPEKNQFDVLKKADKGVVETNKYELLKTEVPPCSEIGPGPFHNLQV